MSDIKNVHKVFYLRSFYDSRHGPYFIRVFFTNNNNNQPFSVCRCPGFINVSNQLSKVHLIEELRDSLVIIKNFRLRIQETEMEPLFVCTPEVKVPVESVP